jgi:hypothetical protein
MAADLGLQLLRAARQMDDVSPQRITAAPDLL